MDVTSQQIQQDWENREFIEILSESIKNIARFLNNFDMSCRSKLAKLDEKLTLMEQKVEYIEARRIIKFAVRWEDLPSTLSSDLNRIHAKCVCIHAKYVKYNWYVQKVIKGEALS